MPTAQRRKRNNILETQGYGKVYCFKANDTFREKNCVESSLPYDFSRMTKDQVTVEENKATDQHKTPRCECYFLRGDTRRERRKVGAHVEKAMPGRPYEMDGVLKCRCLGLICCKLICGSEWRSKNQHFILKVISTHKIVWGEECD